MRRIAEWARRAAVLVAAGVAAGCASAPTRPDPATGEVVFFDDFSAPALNRGAWNVVVTGQWVNNEQQAYVDDSTTIYIARGAEAEGAHEGALVLQARARKGYRTAEGRTFDFVSGRINTRGKFEFAYGTAAARMRLPAGSGLWPAFWALGNGRWPDTGEIDMMENVGEMDWVSSALHGPGYSGNTPLVARYHYPKGEDASGWHVYSVDWSPDSLVFRVDGTESYRVSRTMVEQYGRWAFDNPKFLILNLALGGAYPEGVNAVHSPYPGLPAATVQRIEAARARVLVDWVRVTRR
jgi:beta-glucanase (GH16 family)